MKVATGVEYILNYVAEFENSSYFALIFTNFINNVMARAFLSHSSKQKQSYVEIVAKRLGYNNCIYDSTSFEEGMGNYEEIERGLDKTDVFVLFISEESLNSEWVNKEIFNSYNLLNEGQIQRIFPIIIDAKINHNDSRIPGWMKKEYNLQLVSRPAVAARRIKQRLIEASWKQHPLLKEKQMLFVGRNSYVTKFEERIDSFELKSPVAFFACGFNSIGRKSLLSYAIKKSNIVKDSYQFPTISLSLDESIEDFIQKVYDLGFSDTIDLSNMMTKTVDEKTSTCIKLLSDLSDAKEVLMIIDDGCIVSPVGELATWFDLTIKYFQNQENAYCAIAARHRLHEKGLFKKEYIYSMNISELEIKERIGLLKRYANIQDISLDNESIKIITNNLQGFPEQVFFTIDTIKESGIDYVKDNPHIIVEYNTEKAAKVIEKYQNNDIYFDFLNLLSQFDFISYAYIFDIVGENPVYKTALTDFSVMAVVEFIGATKEYIRVNDTIRDYMTRSRRPLPNDFNYRLKQHTDNFLKTYGEESDIADSIYSIKISIINGGDVPNSYLIPSHFLKSMKEIYERGKRSNLIIELADRVLANSQYMDSNIEREIRYYLCVSLARIGDTRFLSEVQNLRGPDFNFLFGFYYRLSGRSEQAIRYLNDFLKVRPRSAKGQREMVQVLIDIEDYENALSFAKSNYETEKINPYNIQAYIRCLTKVKPTDYKHLIEELIEDLRKINSDISKEMYLSYKAYYHAIFEEDENEALKVINLAISEFPDNPYPLLMKLEICEKFRNKTELEITLKIFKQKNNRANTYRNTAIAFEAKLKAMKGEKLAAIQLIEGKLSGLLPESALFRLKQKINSY